MLETHFSIIFNYYKFNYNMIYIFKSIYLLEIIKLSCIK